MTSRPSHLCKSRAARPTQFDLQAGLQTAAELVHHYGEEFLDVFLVLEDAIAQQSAALDRASQLCLSRSPDKETKG